MTTDGNNKFNIRTGFDLVTSPVPEIPYRIIDNLPPKKESSYNVSLEG